MHPQRIPRIIPFAKIAIYENGRLMTFSKSVLLELDIFTLRTEDTNMMVIFKQTYKQKYIFMTTNCRIRNKLLNTKFDAFLVKNFLIDKQKKKQTQYSSRAELENTSSDQAKVR